MMDPVVVQYKRAESGTYWVGDSWPYDDPIATEDIERLFDVPEDANHIELVFMDTLDTWESDLELHEYYNVRLAMPVFHWRFDLVLENEVTGVFEAARGFYSIAESLIRNDAVPLFREFTMSCNYWR